MELQSKIVYKEIETDNSDLYNYDQKCDIKLFRTGNEHIKKICKKFLRFIEKSSLWNIQDSSYDVCLQVNYWLYDKLASILGSSNTDNIEITFGSFQLVGKYNMNTRARITYNERCKPDFEIFEEDNWDKRKELYEHYINYDTLFSMAQGYSPICEEYYGKIQEMISVYKFFEEKCNQDGYKCPDVFNKCKEKNIVSALEKLPCHETMKAKSVPTSEDGSSHHPPRPAEGSLVHAGGPTAESNTQLESEDSGIGKKVTHTVLGAAPVLLTATALYRYTPFGSWIRKLRGGSTNSMNSMEGFSPYTQESGDMFSDDSANFISYQPI
ncbi:PIR protein [Plasmodium vivax]|nr:PIR protein [Plasmodium vivax]